MYKALLKESYIKRYSETVAVKTLKGARGHSDDSPPSRHGNA